MIRTPLLLALLAGLAAVDAPVLRTDRIRYQPGESGSLHLAGIAGGGPVTVERRTGFDQVETLATINPSELPLELAFDPAVAGWGGGELVALQDGRVLTRDAYAVSDELWQMAIMRGWPPGQERWNLLEPDPAAVAAVVRAMDDEGVTGWECFFWGECDMLDYTPEEERFFGGQGAYPSTVAGHRALIAAAHERGMGATLYANLWGGSGRPAMEAMRRDPELFGNATFHAFILDRWDQLGCRWEMGDDAVRAPGVNWMFNQISLGFPAPLFERHADELIATRRMFGWDGVRYDSAYSQYWMLQAVRLVRARVAAQEPGFRFGFNSIAPKDFACRSLDAMVSGGGLVMGEDIRPERTKTLGAYATAIREWRELIWPYGGHFGMIYNPGKRQLHAQHAWLAAAILAGGAHPYYNVIPNELAAFNAFALRFGEVLWDTGLRPLADPAAVVAIDRPFLDPLDYARYRRLDDGRHRLVLHLINARGDYRYDTPRRIEQPEALDLGSEGPPVDVAAEGEGLLPAQRDVTIRLTLPADAAGIEAWALRADPQPHGERLRVAGDRLQLDAVPLYHVVVVEWSGDTPLATPLSPKAWSDSYLQQWRVLGPFASDNPLGAFERELPPEATPGTVDLAATYAGKDGREIGWIPCAADTAAALGPLPLDFNAATGEHGYLAAGFAYTEITSDAARDAVLHWKADDTLDLWLNGERLVHESRQQVQDYPEQSVPIRLQAGTNRLLVKVVTKWNFWTAYIRLAQADGRPLVDGVDYWTREDLE